MAGNKKHIEAATKKNARVQKTFLMGLAAILILFSAVASCVIYMYQVNSLKESALHKSELVMTAVEANRSYVREELRPKMYEILGNDAFILEAMSSSYISRSVMERFSETIPEFSYRRVAKNARNSSYEAQGIELEMVNYFDQTPSADSWGGIIKKGDNNIFMRFKPVYFTQSCMKCHGDPKRAPQAILNIYGDKKGFFRKEGSVVGVISVGIPVDLNLSEIKEIALIAFLGVIPSLFILYAVVSVFFNRVIGHNISTVLHIFKDNLKDDQDLNLLRAEESLDEVNELTEMARQMSDKLHENRKQLEQAALEMQVNKELLQSVFDGITDPLVLIEKGGKIRIVNRAFLKRYNLHMMQILNKKTCELPTSVFCPLNSCNQIIANMVSKPNTIKVNSDDGERFLIYFYPIHDDTGQTKSLVCYLKDITEQSKLEQQIQQTEKMVSMGQLAAGVAHEINNPLGVILCHLDLIKDDDSLSEETRKDIAIIEKHADNCKNIVADLLDFARQPKPATEKVNINKLITDVISMSSNQLQHQNIELKLNLNESLPELFLDMDKIRQVILNLLINSAHAIEENGVISVSTKLTEDKNSIQIEIEDNGTGINEDIRKKIFDPFFTTKPVGKGTGLGLSVSYGIIQEHNGTIEVKSSTDQNTLFSITLPIPDK